MTAATPDPLPPWVGSPNRAFWKQWVWAWHVLFYGALLWLAFCIVLGDLEQEGDLIPILGLMLFLAVWYGVLVLRPAAHRAPPRMMVLYCVGALLLWLGLFSYHPIFLLLGWVLAAQPFALLPLSWALPAVLLSSGLIGWWVGGDLGFGSLCWLLALAVAGLVTVWQKAMVRQIEVRQSLLETLDATRGELAVAERQAGVLEERQRLAREIHDTVAQAFISVVLHLEAAEGALEADEGTAQRQAVAGHLTQARATARHGLAEARRLVQALRPELLAGRSLTEALQRLTAQWSAETGLTADLQVPDLIGPLPRQVEATLLRIAQEALANVRQHAAARSVTLTLSELGDRVALDVQDDGRGFDPSTAGESGGFGLVGMGERVERMGGRLVIESAAGEGTTLVVELPARWAAEREEGS